MSEPAPRPADLLPSMPSVLVVDDNTAMCVSLSAVLTNDGFIVKTAENGDVAQQILAVTAFDVVVTDISMPRISGIDLLDDIGRTHPDTSVVTITGVPSLATATKALQGGAFDFLVKPFSAEDIVRVVARAAGVARLKGEKRRLALENHAYQERLERMVDERTVALRDSEARLAGILMVAPVGIYVTLRGIIQTVNPAFTAMLGYTPDELIGQNEQLLRGPEATQDAGHDELEQAITTAGAVHSTITMRHKDGGTRHIHVRSAPLRGQPDEDAPITFVALDMTDQLRFQAERDQTRTALYLAQKMDAIGRLASGIAHEINTPSQYVMDNVTFIRDSLTEIRQLLMADQALRASAEVCHLPLAQVAESIAAKIDITYLLEEMPKSMSQSLEGMGRIRKIVAAMREFTHPATETKIAVDVNHLIENTLTISHSEWKYVADTELHLAENLPPVSCMPSELSQVILNLIINAGHAIADSIPAGSGSLGRITISSMLDGDWVEIRIADTGGGIPQAIQELVFEPFFTTKAIGKGTGQGLALAWTVVVDKHLGTLAFESTLGSGTTFIVRLPLNGGQQ